VLAPRAVRAGGDDVSATPGPAQSGSEVRSARDFCRRSFPRAHAAGECPCPRYEFPDWAYKMVRPPNDHEPPNVAAQLAAEMLAEMFDEAAAVPLTGGVDPFRNRIRRLAR
jgi:hypothetical protein